VNVVKGLKLYEDVFSESEICKLTDFVNEIHAAGQNGELSGKSPLTRYFLHFQLLYIMLIFRFLIILVILNHNEI